MGRKNFIIFGILCMVLASAGFGLVVFIKDDTWFFVASLALRLFMGMGDAASSTAIFSIIGSEYT